jgi:hypothetical protein
MQFGVRSSHLSNRPCLQNESPAYQSDRLRDAARQTKTRRARQSRARGNWDSISEACNQQYGDGTKVRTVQFPSRAERLSSLYALLTPEHFAAIFGEFEVVGETHHPRPGQELLIPAGAVHSARNIGSATARWLFGYRRT